MGRRIALLALLTVLLAWLAGLHLYLVERLVIDAGLRGGLRSAATACIGILGAALVLEPICQRFLGPPGARWLAWPASLWLGFLFLLVTLLAASDGVLWLAGASAAAEPVLGPGELGDAGALRALAVVGAAASLGMVALAAGLRRPALRQVQVSLQRWPRALDGFRIVQISDLHIGPILGRRFVAEVVERVNALRPELIAVTGDLVDGAVARLSDEVAPLADLRSRHGVFFVTGNHDHYSGADSWAAQATRLGMQVLRNRRVTIEQDGLVFDLAGVDDHNARLVSGGTGEDLSRALAGRDAERALLLLAHDPSTFKQALRMDVDLQLSGHTHGGQIWPFTILVRLFIPFVAGLYERNGCQLYVSRGTGFWGPPMRLLAPAEITEIVLRAAAADRDPTRH